MGYPAESGHKKNNFLISKPKYMLWVIETVLLSTQNMSFLWVDKKLIAILRSQLLLNRNFDLGLVSVTKMYFVDTQKNRLTGTDLLSSRNISFYGR